MSTDTQLAIPNAPAFVAVAALTGLDLKYIVQTVKAQCFKGNATDAQVEAFISIACEMKVNPLLPGMLYAFPISGGGIVPIMGPSGVYKKLMEHPEVESWETTVFPEDVTVPPTHATTLIHRKGTDKPLKYTALLSEWKVSSNPNWNSRPRHMLGLRSLKHCANQIIHGLPYDEDDRQIMGLTNVTGTAEVAPVEVTPITERPAPKPRATRGAAAAKSQEVVVQAAEQTASEPAKPAEDIQQAMQARQEKLAATEQKVAAPTAAPEPAKPTDSPAPRAFISEGERIETTAKVETLQALAATIQGVRQPAIRATLSGGYNGMVQQKGAGSKFVNDGKEVVSLPPWQVGATLKFVLLGEKSTAPASSPMHGKIVAWVQSVEAVEATEDLS